jgi:hypothetical protein
MGFISGLFPENEKALCVTYFDEAHELGLRLWVMLRLLQYQPLEVGMWYIFMGTKSNITYYAPRPKDRESLIYDRFQHDSSENQNPLSNFEWNCNDLCHRISVSALTII